MKNNPAVAQEGEGVLTITITKKDCVVIDGDVRVFLNEVRGKNSIRLTFVAPLDVIIGREKLKSKDELI